MKAKVLVVDDSALARRRARSILEGAGFDVVEAEDGMAAIERYFVARRDVVLLDLVMKGMDGLDVLSKIRELDPGAKVSANVQTSSHDLVADAGAAGFVVKSFEPDEIVEKVTSTLREAH